MVSKREGIGAQSIAGALDKKPEGSRSSVEPNMFKNFDKRATVAKHNGGLSLAVAALAIVSLQPRTGTS